MDRDDRRALVALSLVEGLGPGRIRSLVDRFSEPTRVLRASRSELAGVAGIGPKLVKGVAAFDRWDLVDAQFKAAEKIGAQLITQDDTSFPEMLRHIFDPPTFMWARGDFEIGDNQSIAIVGTRRASSYGREVASSLAAELVAYGFTIVSGLAYGIDTAAHRGALEAEGRSVAVLGSGVDRIYPSANRALARRIMESGSVFSEFELGAKPDAANFPRRNRIISGMTWGTVVVEAYEDGGAHITARLAVEQNREVFAVPSPIERMGGAGLGCNRLIQRGHAKLVTSVEDIVVEFEQLRIPDGGSPKDTRPADPLTEIEQRLFESVEHEPRHLDTICSESELDASTALVHLLNLEFRGLVRQLGGKQFVRN